MSSLPLSVLLLIAVQVWISSAITITSFLTVLQLDADPENKFGTTTQSWVLACHETGRGNIGRLTTRAWPILQVFMVFDKKCSVEELNGYLALDEQTLKMRYIVNGIVMEISLSQPPTNPNSGTRVEGIRHLPANEWRLLKKEETENKFVGQRGPIRRGSASGRNTRSRGGYPYSRSQA
ncbi:uncharacterized protein LOC128995526 [Macrosteles quadrilineatus]|uniref:uncharacterized protein LOC128995526 n=1 Tax=Macrosteles quadrilineatus TaxID=74068 RepID=UPI0023E146AA|nr:uncharacterized protein LOC128995526 [Macrosteles quadrilineatus]